jgi:hypothetical protein
MSSLNLGFPASICVWIRKAALVLGATLGVLLICLPLFSQGNFGRILGTVTDQSGGVIAGATVTVLDVDRGVSRNLTTDDAGEYNAPNLVPGKYTIRAEAKGFKTVERQNIILEVGKEPRVDLSLQPGEQAQTVTVTESIPLVETTNATLGGTIDNKDINDLPLNGRNYQNLVGLRPGVMVQPGGSPWSQSTNNIRPDETVWMVDGILNANFFDARPVANMPSPFTDAATILPVDAIQEFNLEENPKAEYGWKPGAVVNVGIKSGTNTLHGSAYAFGRSDAFDARNYFNAAPVNGTCLQNSALTSVCNKLPTQLEQFGGVVGGPIKKDKLFFFAGYEGLRDLIGSAAAGAVPETASQATASNPTGDPKNSMVDAIQALQLAGVPRSAVSEKLLGCTEPTALTASCTGGLITNDPANTTGYLSTFPNTNTSNNGIAKIDYHINQKNTLFGTFFLGDYTSNGQDHPFTNFGFTDNSPIRTWSTVVNWIWTPSSSLVNEVRFGYDRVDFNFVNQDVNIRADGTGLTGGSGYPVNTGVTNPLAGGLPNVNVAGFGGGGAFLGTASNRPQYYSPNPYYDFHDDVSYLKGKHTFKFGAEIAHIEADSGIFVNSRGTINFNGGQTPAIPGSTPLEDFFGGNTSGGSILNGNPFLKASWMGYAGFVQDDWRVTPKVTVNLGLRYEYQSPMKAANNAFGSFDPTLGMVQQGQQINSMYKPDRTNFSPRLGFAWDVTGKGTTVVRGGVSIIDSTFVLDTFLGQFVLQNNGATSPAAIPTGAVLQNSGCVTAGTCTPVTTTGGTIQLAAASFTPTQLKWNGVVFPSGANCGDGIGTDPAPCSIMGVDPNLRNPYVENFNLGIQHAFTHNLSLEVGYVGNHGSKLIGFRDINQAPVGAGYCMNTLTPAQAADACKGVTPGSLVAGGAQSLQAEQEAKPYFSKFPYLGYINWMSNQAHSNYHSLQMTLTERTSHGLSFIVGYTYAHGLDSGSLNRFGLLPENSTNPGAEYASSDFDIRHRATFTVTYNIPGKKGFGQMLEGWQINSIVNVQTAQPWVITDKNLAHDFSGTGEQSDRWDFFGNPSDFRSSQNTIPYCTGFGVDPVTGNTTTGGVSCTMTSGIYLTSAPATGAAACAAAPHDPRTLAAGGCYVSGNSVMVPAQLGTFGTMGRNIFRDSAFRNVDFSVFKNFTFRERFQAQFRVEVFNLFNHPLVANPYGASNFAGSGNDVNGTGTFGCGCGTPDFIAGNPLIGSGANRDLQLGLKLTF